MSVWRPPIIMFCPGPGGALAGVASEGGAFTPMANRLARIVDLMVIFVSLLADAAAHSGRSCLSPVLRKDERLDSRYSFRDLCRALSCRIVARQSATAMKGE